MTTPPRTCHPPAPASGQAPTRFLCLSCTVCNAVRLGASGQPSTRRSRPRTVQECGGERRARGELRGDHERGRAEIRRRAAADAGRDGRQQQRRGVLAHLRAPGRPGPTLPPRQCVVARCVRGLPVLPSPACAPPAGPPHTVTKTVRGGDVRAGAAKPAGPALARPRAPGQPRRRSSPVPLGAPAGRARTPRACTCPWGSPLQALGACLQPSHKMDRHRCKYVGQQWWGRARPEAGRHR